MKEQEIIRKIAEKYDEPPNYVREQMLETIDYLWKNGKLQNMFAEKPSIEKFIKVFAKLV